MILVRAELLSKGEGNLVNYKRFLPSGRELTGVWEISADGSTLKGSFRRRGHSNLGPEDKGGTWDLMKSE